MAGIVSMVKNRTGKLSDVKTWTAKTRVGVSNFTITNITPHSGPFDPGVKANIADKMLFKNIGEIKKHCNLEFVYNDGSGITTVCNVQTDVETPAGDCAFWEGYNPGQSPACQKFSGWLDCGVQNPGGTIYHVMPDQYDVTVFFGLKVWGVDESEPSWSMGLSRRGKVKTRPAKAGLSGNQKAAVAGVTGAVVGGLVGYAVGRP